MSILSKNETFAKLYAQCADAENVDNVCLSMSKVNHGVDSMMESGAIGPDIITQSISAGIKSTAKKLEPSSLAALMPIMSSLLMEAGAVSIQLDGKDYTLSGLVKLISDQLYDNPVMQTQHALVAMTVSAWLIRNPTAGQPAAAAPAPTPVATPAPTPAAQRPRANLSTRPEPGPARNLGGAWPPPSNTRRTKPTFAEKQAARRAAEKTPAKPAEPPAKLDGAEPDRPARESFKKPAEPDQKPAEPDQKPAEPDQKPAEPDQKPAEPDQKPAEPDQKPRVVKPRKFDWGDDEKGDDEKGDESSDDELPEPDSADFKEVSRKLSQKKDAVLKVCNSLGDELHRVSERLRSQNPKDQKYIEEHQNLKAKLYRPRKKLIGYVKKLAGKPPIIEVGPIQSDHPDFLQHACANGEVLIDSMGGGTCKGESVSPIDVLLRVKALQNGGVQTSYVSHKGSCEFIDIPRGSKIPLRSKSDMCPKGWINRPMKGLVRVSVNEQVKLISANIYMLPRYTQYRDFTFENAGSKFVAPVATGSFAILVPEGADFSGAVFVKLDSKAAIAAGQAAASKGHADIEYVQSAINEAGMTQISASEALELAIKALFDNAVYAGLEVLKTPPGEEKRSRFKFVVVE
jgi:hypothetical protein